MGYHWLLFHYSDKLNSCDRDDPLTERTIQPFIGKGLPNKDRPEDLKFSAGLQVTSNSPFRKSVEDKAAASVGPHQAPYVHN